MASKLAVLFAATSFIVGCNYGTDELSSSLQKPTAELSPNTQSGENPFGDDPFADIDWNTIELTGRGSTDLSKTVDFQIGDLVPCSDESAELVLEIKAMSGGKCFYRRKQAFRFYDEGSADPSGESGMTYEFTLCAMLINGFASGTFQYVDLAPDSVTVKIEWEVSQGDEKQKFAGEFRLIVSKSGAADAGNGNQFEWSLMRSK